MDLNQKCGKNFHLKDFVECGETQQKYSIENIPKEKETLNAIVTICEKILDPVFEKFGPVQLTFGFCSTKLGRKILQKDSPNIAPKIDQHAGYEKNSRNNLICSRQGIAVDFKVSSVNSKQLVAWIIENLDFDRLYYYGVNRPIHISIGPNNAKYVCYKKSGSPPKRKDLSFFKD